MKTFILAVSLSMITLGVAACDRPVAELKGFKPAKSPEYFKEHKIPSYDKRRIEKVVKSADYSALPGAIMEFSTGDERARISSYYRKGLKDGGFQATKEDEPFGWLLLKTSKKIGEKTTSVEMSISADSSPHVAVYAMQQELAEKPASFAAWGVPTYFKNRVHNYRISAVDLKDPTSVESVIFIGSDATVEILDFFMERLKENAFKKIKTLNLINGSVSIEAEKDIGAETVMVHIVVTRDEEPRVLIEAWLDSWD